MYPTFPTSLNAIVRSCCSRKPTRWLVLFAAALLGGNASAAESVIRLATTNVAGGLAVTWTSPSLTPVAPFVHYEFQVEYSADLSSWGNATLVPGGFVGSDSVPRTFVLPRTNTQGFVRLNYRLNMPGANLAGLDLSRADLRGANLAGANLSGTTLDGALLGGANLSGATLAGATFGGANLQGVDLTGFDLSAIDLSTILGMPSLTQVTANPLGSAAELVPTIPYNASAVDFPVLDESMPGMVSERHAMVMLETNVTIGQLNALLARYGASIVAASPRDALLPNAVLMARLPATNATGLFNRIVALEAEPEVALSAPDVLMELDEVPISTGTAPGWNWDVASAPSGGNWGLERARVPQMWNLVSALETRGVNNVSTWILDVDFPTHEDVPFQGVHGPTGPGTNDHGIHVGGIAGARWNNGKGIDGVNPFISMSAFRHETVAGDETNVDLGLVLNGFDPGRSASAYRMVQDVRDVLGGVPDLRLVNMSMGFNWHKKTNGMRPLVTNQFSALDQASISAIAGRYGRLMADVVASAPGVLIVCSAGNSFGLVSASDNSPMANAALIHNAANIVVVEAHGINAALADFSNTGGDVAAPGVDILSAAGTIGSGYETKDGTSMATPFVTGVAGFLLAVDPMLDPPTLKNLLRLNGTNVDAFTSVMGIDTLPGRDREVLKLLLDVDDGSVDGSRRVLVPPAAFGRERSFVEVTGPDFTDDDHVVGDGVFDMSDFRRWRDWLLHGEGNNSLNGSASHLKNDGNGGISVNAFRDKYVFPRGDFNGDGKLDRDTLRPVPGFLGGEEYSDLEVLLMSLLWEDEGYTDEFVLYDLMDSVDLHVSATNFYQWNREIGVEAGVTAFNSSTHLPVLEGVAVTVSPDVREGVLTVPTGGRYYVGSLPIDIGGGTNVMMRSLGDRSFALSDRGGDFAVDLMLAEMTAVAETFNPDLRDIHSQPNTNRVHAYVGNQPEDTEAKDTVGARASASEEATIETIANAGGLPESPLDSSTNTVFKSGVSWQRSFIKDSDLRDPRFLIKKLEMELVGSGAGTDELHAFTDIILEMRAFDLDGEWQPFFTNRVEIAGKQASGGQPSTFRIVEETGGFPPKPLEPIGEIGVRYEQRGERTPIDLEGIPDGHSFELRLRLHTRVESRAGGDVVARASLGDPLEAHSGFRMVYGRFGDLPSIKKVSRAAQAAAAGVFQAAAVSPVVIEYLSKTNFYYRLYQGANANTDVPPLAMKLGVDGDDTMTDPNPVLAEPTEDDYTLENQPLDQPLDFDGDGIDDVYELRRPGILNPLSAADAFLDPDGDNRSNLEEYQQGTDPQTPDSPPTSPTLNFPGLLVPTYDGGELIDINNDGLLDSAGPAMSISLAHLGGTFDTQVTSPRPGVRIVSATAYVKLDGDAFPDAVIVDQLTNRVFTFRGVGDGTFVPLNIDLAINSPNSIALCNLNGDALQDIAIFSQNGRGVDLHLNNGDGTLTRLATVTTNAYGSGNSFAMADLNNDSRDDIIVGYANNAVVFLTQPNGSYGQAQPYPVGSSPSSLAVGDLNGDGRLDIVAANASTDDLSVLIASAPGTFLPQVRYPVGDNPRQLRLARLRTNGPLDAVVSLNNADYQTILPGVGDGTFGPRYTVGAGTSLTAIHDWNDDGKLDFAGTISSSGGLIVLGNGDGTFDTRVQIVPTNNAPTQVTAVDLDGDGKLELVGLQSQRNSIDVWEHAAATGTNRLLASFVVGPLVTGYAPGDFNGDGRVDLAVTTQTNSFGVSGSNQVVVLTNAGNLVFQNAGHYPVGVRANGAVAGDFNGDGRVDLAIHAGGGTINGGSQLVSMLNDGAGGFQAGPAIVVANTLASVLVANAEADARAEILLRGSRIGGPNFLEVFALDSSGGWTNRQSLAISNSLSSAQVLLANRDAFPDVIVAKTDSVSGIRSLSLYPGGAAGFGNAQTFVDDVEFNTFTRLADLNNDGLLDVVGGNTIYLARQSGGYHPAQPIWIGIAGAQGVADFNRDGKMDLFNGLSVLLQK